MALEGLQAVLNKEAVLATASVNELLEAPQVVEERYKHHVRAYLPLGRAAGSKEDQLSVREYEKRLIKSAKEGTAPTGYLTAYYGYGKTSTAAFLWQQCCEANLLAVPPFNIRQLLDLLTAAYAWGRYELKRTRPQMVDALEQLYRSYMERGIETLAQGSSEKATWLADLHQQGYLQMGFNTADYLSFFERYTELMREAGYDGVVLLPDELQQYIDPTINSGERDPLSNLFQLVHGLATRPRGKLHATIIFLMPSKELGQISEQRRDIIDRLQAGGLGFDLNGIYDADFAIRLWERLAREFDFRDVAGAIVEQSALRGLGEIAAREDLGSGPRTVVDGFRVMIERYLAAVERGDTPATYSPINLSEDLLAGRMNFASPKFKRDVSAVLSNRLVVGQTERELATKLLAAFPSNGASDALIKELGLTRAVADLVEQQLTIYQGGRDAEGKLMQGVTLRDLAPNLGGGDWLTSTISEFIRMVYTYQENSSKVIERAANAFKELLLKRVFKGKWRVADDVSANPARDAALLIEGSLPQTVAAYPDRQVYLKIVRDGNRAGTKLPPADLVIEFDLRRYLDLDEEERRRFAGKYDDRDQHHLKFALNVAHQSSDEIYPTLQQNLGNIVSPQRLTPLLLLNIYARLSELMDTNQVPKNERGFVSETFMPDLLDVVTMELFNPQLTEGRAGNTRIIEDAFVKSMREQFPSYATILNRGANKAIIEYNTALSRLPNPYQRSGVEPVAGSKEAVAALLNRTNTLLDTFISDYPTLLRVAKVWKSGQEGEVLFTLHPWEQIGLEQLSGSADRDPLSGQPRCSVRELQHEAAQLGYRDEEIDNLMLIMKARGLAEVRDGYLVRLENKAISVNELRQRLNAHLSRLTRLLAAFASNSTLLDQHTKVSAFINELDNRQPPDDRALASREATLANYVHNLDNWRRGKHDEIYRNLRLVRPADGPSDTERAAIAGPYAGPLAGQIEPLRERAAAEVERSSMELVTLVADYRHLQQMVPKLDPGNPPLDDETLIAAQQAFEALRRAKEKSDADVDYARRRISEWREVSSLMNHADDVQREIEAEGAGGKPAALAYQDWERKVREQLSVNKLAAFAAAADWRNDLSRVKQSLAQVRETASNDFNEMQAAYRDVLRKAGVPSAQMPITTEYNSRNPDNSRSRLRSDVLTSWQGLLAQLARHNQQLGNDVQQISTALDPDMEPRSREQLQSRCTSLSDALTANKAPIMDLLEANQAVNAGAAEFDRLRQPLDAMRSTLTHIQREVSELRDNFTSIKLSDPSRDQLHRLMTLPVEGEDYVDLATVLQADVTIAARDQSWQSLKELFDKQRVRIKVQVIKNG